MDKLGLGYAELATANPRLVYCSARGFLAGPYENRTALDEVAQMMGGLAYMTGPPGRPLRAGASVIDVTGGMFGVIGILAALEARHRSGLGQEVKCSLFETTAFLVGQHMAQFAVTGKPAAPMPERISAWAIYDIFATADDDQVFVGVVSDAQWLTFCKDFELDDLYADESLRANGDRVRERGRIMPIVQECLGKMTRAELMGKLEESGLPFAPVSRPEDLFDDPHLRESGGLVSMSLPDGTAVSLPALPLEMAGEKAELSKNPPGSGEHTAAVLRALGYSDAQIAELEAGSIVSGGD